LRAVAAVGVVPLAGTATALAGPILLLGLMVPHLARRLTGPDYRWVIASSAVLGPILLLGADVVGRLVLRPAELEAGLVVAFLGAPVPIMLVRRARLAGL
ncbi:MAG: iron chelate uptake ABC transporter family permease subunit, partial [Cellulomonas sp.]|nr:iron chelate uptake ABC transporter family permease subunit [Cellulomonas sp.]